jgi:hypothetical protein
MPTVESRLTRSVARLVILAVAVVSTMALTTARALAADGAPAQQVVTTLPAQVAADAKVLADEAAQFDARYVEDDSSTAASLLTAVRRDVNAGRVSVHLPQGTGIVAAESMVWRDRAGGHLVRLPYAGSVVSPSGLVVAFDAKGHRLGTLEHVYQERTATSGTVAVWANGELKKSVLVDASGAVSPERTAPQAAAPDDVVALGWWSRFNHCLSNLGVPGWVINAIAIACATVCVLSAGTGCLACLAVAAAGYAWEISYCIDQAT